MVAVSKKFTCKVELSKNEGITIVIRDLSKPTQEFKQIVLCSESLTITTKKEGNTATVTQTDDSFKSVVKTPDGETTIEQGPEEVKVTCKVFTVDAESIELKSKKATKHTAGEEFTVESTKALSLQSKAAASIESTDDLKLSSKANAKLEATQGLDLKAGTSGTFKASQSLKVSSDNSMDVAGLALKLEGKASAVLEAPDTKVGKNLTTIKGSMIQVSGSMIKLG